MAQSGPRSRDGLDIGERSVNGRGARGAALSVLVLAVLLVGACSAFVAGEPSESQCNGIDAAVGGCDPDLPSFSATTCDAVADEAGRQLDARLRAVYAGPEETDGETRAVRAGQVESLTIGLANQHLRRIGLTGKCPSQPFVTRMELAFSDTLRQQAGAYLYDGEPVSYETWRADLASIASILDMP